MKREGKSKASPSAAPSVERSTRGRARRTFTEEYKRDILALVRRRREEQATWAQIGRELELRPALLFQWKRELEAEGDGARAQASPTGLAGETLEDENRRLRRENAILREERAFAKKAAAFFAKESR